MWSLVMGRPCCCGAVIAVIKYDSTNGDILWQRLSGTGGFELTWDDTNDLVWHSSTDRIFARSLAGELMASTADIATTDMAAKNDGGLIVYGTPSGGGTTGFYEVNSAAAVVGVYGSFPSPVSGMRVMSNGDLVYGSPLTRRATDGSLIWTASASGPAIAVSPSGDIAVALGSVVSGADGTTIGSLTGGGTFSGTSASNGYWGGVVPGSPTNVFLAQADTTPVWDLNIANDGVSCGCTDGSNVYVSTYDTGTAPVRNTVRKYDSSGALVWEQVGPQLQASYVTRSMIVDGDGHVIVGTSAGLRVKQSEWIN